MTRQQQLVLDYIRTAGCATATDLTEDLHHKGESVGLTTVYRQLEKLVRQGLVHKIVTDNGARFQYCDAHARGTDCFLLKCERCGQIEHVDCAHLGELYAHLMTEHHFTINPRKTLFYGLCEKCAQEEII